MKTYYHNDLNNLVGFINPSKLLKNQVGNLEDIQKSLERMRKESTLEDRLLITCYNHLWEPVLKLATVLGWRESLPEQNWLDDLDLKNFCDLSGWEVVNGGKRLLLPIWVPILSDLVNKWIAPLPLINNLCLTTWVVARPEISKRRDYSVSIIVPARNEAGNVTKIPRLIPKFGKWQELIFVEGHSWDNTWEILQKLKVKAFKQSGKGKADAVRLGFDKARGEMLFILDADLTVEPKDLPKFYEVIASGMGEFVNGCRLVYPMEKEAMRMLNKLGNKFFGWAFSWILGQRFKDTLCGTKVLLKKDYEKIAKKRGFFGNFDPFGDFDLIFGAVKQNLKVVEVPIRYRERTYGSTNISRFRHGWLLAKMTWFAFRKFKAW